jgi:hypothetical protein
VKIAEIYNLDSSETEDLSPISCFAAIIQQLISGMDDDSREIRITVMDTIDNIVMFFKDTMEPLIFKVI